MLGEAEPGAEGEADEPVGAEVADHRRARVAGAAESAGGYGLDAVEELEGGTGSEEHDSGVDENGVVCVDAGNVLREDEKNDAHEGHERGAEQDGGVAGVARAGEIAASDGLADANGGGGRDAEGNHVGESDGVERDLVAGEGNGAKTGDQGGDGGEDGDFGGHLHSGGKAECDEPTDAREIRARRCSTHFGVVARVVPEKKNDQDGGQVGARDGGGDAGADYAEHGKTPVAEDEEIVAEDVDEIGGDEGEGDGANEVHPLQGATEGEVEEQGDEAEGQGVHIGAGEDGDVGRDTEAIVEMREKPDRCEQERRKGEAEVDAVDERVKAVFTATSAERLGDERVEADE